MNKKRFDWLDIAKGIAIIATVVGHVSLIDWDPYRRLIFSFHMPLFFIVAGFTAKAVIDLKSTWKLFTRVFIPYILVAGVTSIIFLIRGSDIKTEIFRLLWASGVPANYGPGVPVTNQTEIPVVGMLWFLPCMFFSKLLFSFALKITEKFSEYIRAAVILLVCIGGFILGRFYKIPMGLDIALFVIVFFYAGYLLKKSGGLVSRPVSFGLILTVLWGIALSFEALELSARFYRDFPYCIFTTLGAIAASILVFYLSSEMLEKTPAVNRFLIFCGKNSLTILCIHHLESSFINWGAMLSKIPYIASLSPLNAGFVQAIVRVIFCSIICFVYIFIKSKVVSLLKQKKARA